MIDVDNRTDKAFDFIRIETMGDALTDAPVELVLCDDAAIRDLNRDYRQIDKATDVLSFPYDPMPMAPLGSIVISVEAVARGALAFGHDEADELALLFLHGMLHLLGFDHETDTGEMRAEEAKLIAQYGLPGSLIVRTETE